MLRAGAVSTEASRSLNPATVTALKDAGLFSIFKPRRYGGYELDWGPQIQAGRILGAACASTAWVVSVVGSHAGYAARLKPEAQDDIWGDGADVIISTGSAPTGAIAEPANGGYKVSGQWRFCSGIDHASWVLLPAPVQGAVDGRQDFVLLPSSDIEILDDWHVAGMSGTGSRSVLLSDIYVPKHRTLRLATFMSANPPGATVNEGGVYRCDFRLFGGTAMLGPIVGAAEGALSGVVEMLGAGSHPGAPDPTNSATQLLIAEAAAEISTAACLLEDLLARQARIVLGDGTISLPDRVALLRDRTYSSRLCVRAVERLVRALDADSAFEDHPVQRQYRDLAAMSQQIGINWDRNMASCGQNLLGLPSIDPFLNVEQAQS
jgi:3-hydroxy-9,10-secoandrosta-1,3,5(10)-triene-9,17-dione monooxygenase